MSQSERKSNWLLFGNVPLLVVGIFCVSAYLLGNHFGSLKPDPAVKYAVVGKGEIAFQTILDNPDLTPEQVEKIITSPTLELLKKYAHLGYIVIDSTKDESGNYVIAGIPENSIDFSSELRSNIQSKLKQATETP